MTNNLNILRKKINDKLKKVKNEKIFYIIFDYIKDNNIKYTLNSNGVFFNFKDLNRKMLNEINKIIDNNIIIKKENKINTIFNNMKSIKFLKTFKIQNALPSNPKFFNFQEKSFYRYTNNIYFAGDFLSYPCLNGSIQSGINLVESLES